MRLLSARKHHVFRLTKKKIFLLVGAPLTLLVGGALLFNVQALTGTIYPDGDVTPRGWPAQTGCTATTYFACVNETPHSTANYINTDTGGSTGETVEFTMSSVAASNVNITQFAVTINAHSVACLGNSTNCDTLTVRIRKGGTLVDLGASSTVSMTTTNTAYTFNFNGNWTSDSDLQVQVERTRVGGGNSANADDDVRLTGLRAVVTYTQNYSIEQASYRWFDNTTATSGDTFSRIATSPFGTNGKSVAWSPNTEYLSIATESSPYVRVYKRSGDTLTALTGLPTFPNTTTGLAWSPDNTYMSLSHHGAPYISIYKRSGDTFTKLTTPTIPAGNSNGISWSADGQYMSVAHANAPYISVYKRSGDTFTKLADPSSTPTGTGRSTSWSADGTYMSVSHEVSPFITIYKRSGDTFTKLANPTTLPTGIGNSTSWSADGQYMSVAHATSPFITIYKRSGDTFTKLANPTTLPTGIGNSTSWSADGQYMSVAHATSPFITIYKRSGDTFTKLANPTTLPGDTGNSVSWSSDGQYMSVAHDNTLAMTLYKRPLTAEVGVPLAAVNTAATGPAPGEPFRLRMNLGISGGQLASGEYKLQYAYRSNGVCSVSGVTYDDITSSTPIKYYDNTAIPQGAGVATNANDPTRTSITAVRQTYNESNPFSVATAIPAGQDGIWDFALTFDESAETTGSYCIKATTSTGQGLNSYSVIPQISAPVPSYSQSSYRFYENADSLTPGAPLATQNTTATIALGTSFRLRQLIGVGSNHMLDGTRFKLQYAQKTTTCSSIDDPLIKYFDLDPGGSLNGYTNNVSNIQRIDGADWQNISNVTGAADDVFTEAWLDGSVYTTQTDWIRAQSFNLSVPAEANIDNITVTVNAYKNSSSSAIEPRARLISSTEVGTSVLSSEPNELAYSSSPTGANHVFSGTPTDWGINLNSSTVNSQDFGLEFYLFNYGDTYLYTKVLVDSIEIKIDYSFETDGTLTYMDNPTAADKEVISLTPNDPQPSSGTIVGMTYNESGLFDAVFGVPSGGYALWDAAITTSNTASGTYCFRVVNEDGSAINNYEYYPEITIGETGSNNDPTLNQQLRGGQSVVDGVKNPFSW